ncbi:MAG TPA: hypothetical protein VMW91_02235 [Desulfosporosinus sp.]|nr:hypothetical protein [Desulfosporosinus sp.]
MMAGQLTILNDPRGVVNGLYCARLYEGNLYTYEWQNASPGKVPGWYLLNTVVRNPDYKVLDTTAYYPE